MSGGGPTAASLCPDCGDMVRPTGGARYKEHHRIGEIEICVPQLEKPVKYTPPEICPGSGKEFPRRWNLAQDAYPEGMVGKPCMVHDRGDIQVWYKPPGLDTHPGKWTCDKHERTLFHDIRQTTPGFSNANRIDKWTSGLLMAGNHAGAGHLRRVWGDAHKTYACVIENPDWDEEICSDELKGKQASTGFRVVDRDDRWALVEAKLLNAGRTHQIRLHSRILGYPIVDDLNWKSPRLGKRAGQLLHCWKMEVPMPDGHVHFFESAVPDDMQMEGLSWV